MKAFSSSSFSFSYSFSTMPVQFDHEKLRALAVVSLLSGLIARWAPAKSLSTEEEPAEYLAADWVDHENENE